MLANLKTIPSYFLRPLHILRAYQRSNLQPDLVAGLTVAVILLPQAIAYALIAELPPQAGLYTAIVAAIVGALWGSSNHLQTGPTNAASLLVLSIVLTVAAPGSPEFMATAGLMAVMVGLFRLVMGLARLGMLVNFVSDSVIVGFTAGAGVLISVNQLRPLLRLDFPTSSELGETAQNIVTRLPEMHWPSLALGLGTIGLIVLLQRLSPKWPGPLIGMMCAAVVVWLVGLEQQGVKVIGQLPRGLPPLAQLPLFDLERIGQLSTGALAIAAIGLVEAMSIARSIASQTGQRLDNHLVEEIRTAGARVMLASDGDIAGALLAAAPQSGADVLMGVGGVPEGVIAACAVKAIGGTMLGRLSPQGDAERSAVEAAGLDTRRILTCDELVSSNEIIFSATGITDGPLLDGVRYHGDRAETQSLTLRCETKTRRIIHAEHLIE